MNILQSRNPNAPFVCGTGKSLGRAIGEKSLFRIYDNYKKEYFPKLIANPNVPPEDKQKILELLQKPWNPYIRRALSLLIQCHCMLRIPFALVNSISALNFLLSFICWQFSLRLNRFKY